MGQPRWRHLLRVGHRRAARRPHPLRLLQLRPQAGRLTSGCPCKLGVQVAVGRHHVSDRVGPLGLLRLLRQGLLYLGPFSSTSTLASLSSARFRTGGSASAPSSSGSAAPCLRAPGGPSRVISAQHRFRLHLRAPIQTRERPPQRRPPVVVPQPPRVQGLPVMQSNLVSGLYNPPLLVEGPSAADLSSSSPEGEQGPSAPPPRAKRQRALPSRLQYKRGSQAASTTSQIRERDRGRSDREVQRGRRCCS